MLATEDFKATATQFVQKLASDLSKDNFDLPGFPDVVMRLHNTLSDESSSAADVVRLVSSEPSLAARLVQLANSAAFNADGREIKDPRAAIQRLGFNVVRSTATSFAVKQLENQEWLMPVRSELKVIWRRSNAVAASCFVLGGLVDEVNSDEAMAAGLFHQLGNLYLFAHGHKDGLPVVNNPEWDEIVAGWHPVIARAILENWGISECIATAVENQDALIEEEPDYLAQMSLLTRLLSASKYNDLLHKEPDSALPEWANLLAGLKLNGEPFSELFERGQEKIETISQMIS